MTKPEPQRYQVIKQIYFNSVFQRLWKSKTNTGVWPSDHKNSFKRQLQRTYFVVWFGGLVGLIVNSALSCFNWQCFSYKILSVQKTSGSFTGHNVYIIWGNAKRKLKGNILGSSDFSNLCLCLLSPPSSCLWPRNQSLRAILKDVSIPKGGLSFRHLWHIKEAWHTAGIYKPWREQDTTVILLVI